LAMTHPTPWLVHRPGPKRPVRLYCFAYAGGHAGVFMPWQAALEPDVEVCAVQMPGRGSRVRERPMTSIPALVEQIAQVIAVQDDRPFAFFGHSLGALLAFEVARHGARNGLPAPAHLFVSGCEAPAHRGEPKNLHLLPDAQLLDELRGYNGTPPEVLANSELMELVLAVMRVDFALEPGYVYQPGPKLPMPMTVLAGSHDRHGLWNEVARWGDETTGPSRVQWFDGDHFFINNQQQEVLDCVRRELRDLKSVIA
ncbi:MAG: thioesterase II family protein, partial [Lysobacter sp.]